MTHRPSSGSTAPPKPCLSIRQLFEEQVELTPDRVAVVFGDRELTYRALDRQANRFARYLIRSGVGAETPVGIFMERSIEMVVATWGIFKSGGACVPLDTAHPAGRLAGMIEDARVRLVVTDSRLKHRLPAGAGQLVCPEEAAVAIGQEPAGAVEENASFPDRLAYLVYTSGSTGRPKGVLIPDRAFSRCRFWAKEIFEFTTDDRFLFKSVRAPEEIFFPLFTGAQLVIAPPGAERDAGLLINTLIEHRITVAGFSPALLGLLLDEADLEGCSWLKHVLCAGEALPADLPRRFFARSTASLYNFYGLAEAPFTTLWRCRPNDSRPVVPIGKPVDAEVCLLNTDLQPVAAGETGEIYIGGPGLARGYLNRPDATAERFISHPWSEGARLYKTGDLAYADEQGEITFAGRVDHQVKIRGFRVELGEIEAALRQHPAVREAAVLLKDDDGRNGARLTAYLVLRPQALVPIGDLRGFLAEKLPDHAIPARFVATAALPLTVTGKVDRQKLKHTAGAELGADAIYAAARSENERQLVGIWEKVLQRERLGIRENFFDLGGHSITAAAICARLSRLRGIEVPVRWILEHPTVEALAGRIESAGARPQNVPTLEKADRSKPLPMSFGQQRMWVLQQVLANPSTYNVPVAWRLRGHVDRDRVRRALQAMLERHEVLRTALVQQGGQPVQRIAGDVALPWKVINGRAQPLAAREPHWETFLAEAACRPFDLAQAPLWRVVWVENGPDDHAVGFTFHHGIVDEWSLRLFFEELARLYETDGQKDGTGLPELQYADYSAWQKQRLTGPLLERQRAYWEQQLHDLPPELALPTDLARPARASGAGAAHEFQLGEATGAMLRELARKAEVTLFTLLLAAFHVWLHRYTGQTDVVVSVPIAKREQARSTIGFFLNTLPIRVRLAEGASFRTVLSQVREALLQAFDHADLPFEEIAELAAAEHERGRQPLHQVMFAFAEESAPLLQLGHAEARPLPVTTQTSKNDLTLSIRAAGESWDCRFEYAADLFQAGTVARMARHLTRLLQAVAAAPEEAIHRLNLLPEEERHCLLVEWNRTERAYPGEKGIHRLFEEQAERTPEAVAVVFKTESLTYRQLNHRANRFARVLVEAGAGPEARIGLCLERSATMVMAMLAVLKAGGVYVPIDPSYPAARKRLMLEGVPLLVTTREFPDYAGRILGMGEGLETGEGGENLIGQAGGGNLAYVLYTSGSTGHPKGVAVPHRAVNRLVINTNYIALDGSDVVAQTSNCCFDAATFEIWGALLNGARLVIIEKDVVLSPAELSEELRRQGVTTLWLTTSLFNLMAQHAPGAFSGLRHVLFGGEPADARSVAEVLRHGAPRHLINGYGPTETTTFAVCHEVRSVPEHTASLPIGKPISNTTVYVLDAWQSPVPIGVPGEIYVGGPGLARGYLDAPELTRLRFVPDPFSRQPGARLYRTGDLGRWLAEGTLEYRGRLDDQVKIRGFRIEPGEIETALKTCPGVRDAVVVLRGQAGEEKHLVAYIAGAAAALPEHSLREHLKAKLPDYMVPSSLVVLDRFPLNPQGKVDRRALPEPAVSRAGKVSPRDALETQLVAIWEKALERFPVGVTDNFFELGGNSLRAVRVFAEIRQAFGKNLPVAALFKTPTVETLARTLRAGARPEDWSPLVPIQLRGNRPPFFGVHGVHGNVLFYRPLALLLGKEQPFYGVQSQGLDGAPITHTSVEAMAEYYVRELRKVQPSGPYLIGGYSLGGSIAYEMARRLRLAGETVPLLVLIDAGNPARPARLISYRARLRKALRDPASLFTVDRLARILAGRIRGNAGDRFLKWNDRYQRAKARRLGAFRDETAEIDLHVVMVHTRALLAYRPLPFDGTITLFRTREPEPGYQSEPCLGWESLAQGGIDVHEIPGAHLELFSDENVRAVARALQHCIQSALEKPHKRLPAAPPQNLSGV